MPPSTGDNVISDTPSLFESISKLERELIPLEILILTFVDGVVGIS